MQRRQKRTAWILSGALAPLTLHAQAADEQLRRQQERERVLREQQEAKPDVRLAQAVAIPDRIPLDESPCFQIHRIRIEGEESKRFNWALKAANPSDDPAGGRCLGTNGVNAVLKRIQNAVIARGYVTTRVLAAPQDLKTGALTVTVVPGRLHAVRLADGTDPRATWANAMSARPGDLLNLREIEQALENLQRVPTVTADIQIAPSDGADAKPGESDLVIAWKQGSRWRGSLGLDDAGSSATGRLQASATLSLDHLLQVNDLFYANVGHDAFNREGQGTRSWTAHYDVPNGFWLFGATASGYEYHQTVPGFSQSYVYSGSSRNAELRAARLVFRNATTKTGVYARGWWRKSNNFIDDTEVLVQRRRAAGWELGTTHRQFLGPVTLDASVAYRRGTGAFAALPAPEEPFGEGTSRFKLITADAQVTVPFHIGSQSLRYTGSGRGQWHRTPLVPQDRFAIGGRYTVRGFDGEASLSGESGWLWRNDIALALGGGQELYLAADVGHVRGPSADQQLGDRLAGAAVGLRGGMGPANWDVFVGSPIDRPSGFPTAYTTLGFSFSRAF